MYSIEYEHQAVKDLLRIEKDKKLFEQFEKICDILKENPYHPNLPKSKIPRNGIKMNGVTKKGLQVYHVKLTKEDRIFYTIDKNKEIILINNIEIEGIVKLMKLLGHDL